MEAEFWHQMWKKGDIGFHEGQVNRMLARYGEKLNLAANSRILVPLCGKSLDMNWFLSRGHQVVGAELNESAVVALFQELGFNPNVTTCGDHKKYQYGNLSVFVGDFFQLTPQQVQPIDAIYDRAALVALPDSMRVAYSQKLTALTNNAKQLLICFEYDQTAMSGPPFAIMPRMVAEYYQLHYQLDFLARSPVEGGLKGLKEADETVWLLSPTTE